MQIEYLRNNPWQPRLEINTAELAPLVASIKRYGFSGYIEARRDPHDPHGPLQIVYGHRRVKAAQLAGLTTLPIHIIARTDEEMREMAFLENHTQKPLSYWEEALYFDRLRKEFNYSIREIADMLGVSKGYVQHRVEILRLEPGSKLRQLAERNQIDLSTALALEPLANELPEDEFNQLLEDAQAKTMTSQQLRRLAQAKAAGAAIEIERDDEGRRIWRAPASVILEPNDAPIDRVTGPQIDHPVAERDRRPMDEAGRFHDLSDVRSSQSSGGAQAIAQDGSPLGGQPVVEPPRIVFDRTVFVHEPERRAAQKLVNQITHSVTVTEQYAANLRWEDLNENEQNIVLEMNGRFRQIMDELIPA